MRLKYLELNGFKSFAKKVVLEFNHPIVSIVGPNGSGKSNVVEAFRYVLGEQSIKSMRGKSGSDLIFKGSKNLPKGNMAMVNICLNNTDQVFKLLSEENQNINLNFDEINIKREVYIDGVNKYILNDSEVRLKDINNLLSSVNIGSSSHHIISQGEADRVLNASPRDLKEIVLDVLGLKIYQYKIKEGERKLEKSNENIKEALLLRRENAPHLRFLKSQVDKFEKSKQMREELFVFYKEYFKKESIFFEKEKSILNQEKEKLKIAIDEVISQIGDEKESQNENTKLQELREVENNFSNTRRIKNEIERKLGRIEGMLEVALVVGVKESKEINIETSELNLIFKDLSYSVDKALQLNDIFEIKNILENVKKIISRFDKKDDENENVVKNSEIENLKENQRQIQIELANLEEEEKKILENIKVLKDEIQKERDMTVDKERARFNLKVRQQELSSAINLNSVKQENLNKYFENYQNEIKEAEAFFGEEIYSFKEHIFEGEINKTAQEELKRKIERLKIKLEDIGMTNGADILKEFEEVKNRDEFLEKEIQDLNQSIESLEKLILDLREKINLEFKAGIKEINIKFKEFFVLMFGGGEAELSIIKIEKRIKEAGETEENEDEKDLRENEEEKKVYEEGVEIDVALPHKKVKELHSLSGGERSLVSIALLFAMSSVNPPPFLILDETDAALDEANSRKYGDMLELLSKHSQLVVITHNRETMSRAGVLYGVTIGYDGASKLLSIKFEEATAIAK